MQPLQYGDPRVSHQLWAKIEEDTDTGCWIWFGAYTPSGWPSHAHRAAWRTLYSKLVGPVPPNVSMTCDMDPKECLNPYHRLNPYGADLAPHLCTACGQIHNPT